MPESIAELEARIALLAGELSEARAEQAATSEILRVISSSPTDLQPVFDSIAESAARLCAAQFCFVHRFDGTLLHFMAHHGLSPEALETVRRAFPMTPGRESAGARAVLSGAVEQIPDVFADADYLGELAEVVNSRSVVAVPMMQGGVPIGAIVVDREQPGYFPARQIELLQTFADQAVIAIENARLFNEVQARNREVMEALEQQTATAEVLKTISSSAFDLDAVLHTLVKSAADLCHAAMGCIYLRDGDAFRAAMQVGWTQEFYDYMSQHPMRPGRGSVTSRAALTASIVHIPDALDDPEYTFTGGPQIGGFRTLLGAPLIRDGEVMGVFVLARSLVQPFSQREIELVKTFSDQAVIALENVRLFDEVQARTAELSQALKQQTATADVLKVISRSAFDLPTVLDTLVASAARLCTSTYGGIYLREGDRLRAGATVGAGPEEASEVMSQALEFDRKTISGRVALSGQVEHIADVLEDAEYDFPTLQKFSRIRALMGVPLLREGKVDGVFFLGRPEPGAFTARQAELVQTFADQAVIAIENVRLFEQVQARNREVTEALEQQTATSEILRVIAASPTNIQPVLKAVAESAAQLCDAYDAIIFLRQGDLLVMGAHHGPIPIDFTAFPATRDWVTGRAVADRVPVHVHDLSAAGDEFPAGQSMSLRLGHRTILATPLLREDEAIGGLVIRRREVRPFSDKQIELLKTFADQAVIAIENVRLFEEVQARNREVTEALEQQTATGAILRVIAASPTDIQPVLQVVAESAAQFCDTHDAVIFLRQGDILAMKAHHGPISTDFAPLPIGRDWVPGRAVVDGKMQHVHDLLASGDEFPLSPLVSQRLGFRTSAVAPLMRKDEAIGALAIRRTEVRPFSDKQIELLKTFADQAVIAIENVRLFDEVQARNQALTESLEQQTATNDVLSVISSSPTNLQPVFDMIAERSARLCDAEFCAVFRFDGQLIHFVAEHGLSPAGHKAMTRTYPIPPGRSSTTARAVTSGKVEQIPDVDEDPDYAIGDVAKAVNARSIAAVPMLKNNRAIGAISVAGSRPGLFAARQIALLQTFADQAVIAIENVRLFDEVQARTAELSEALRQQTATADVLKVISRSAFDLPTVLDTLVESAIRVCEADKGAIFQRKDDLYHFAASFGYSEEYEHYARENPVAVGRDSVTGRVALEAKTIHIADVLADPAYKALGYQQLGGYRTSLGVPLLSKGLPVGAFVLTRPVVKPFTEKQIELVETFADQAVIAIENVRLFDEVQARTAELGEALTQQTATADVLKVISRSTFDLQAVLDALAESVTRLCEADSVGIVGQKGDRFVEVAAFGYPPEVGYVISRLEHRPGRGSVGGRVLLEGKTVQVADVLAEPDYALLEEQRLMGFRTVLGVPLLRAGQTIGIFVLTRSEVKPFTDKQIELVETFADQAVIAIENVRLFEQVQARTAELGEALRQQTATADVLKVISRSAFDLPTVLQTLVDSAIRLCGADMGAITLREGDSLRYMAGSSQVPELLAYERAHPHPLGRGTFQGRAALEGTTIHVPDVFLDAEYERPEAAKIGNFRAALSVPLRRGGEVIGVFGLARREVGPFAQRQIELVESFADQAVIAVENARLFEEVQARTAELSESLQQQTATADVLKVISASAFDLQAVLDTLTESAGRLCEADMAGICRSEGQGFYYASSYGFPPDWLDFNKTRRYDGGRGSVVGRVLLDGSTVLVADVLADAEYTFVESQKKGGFRTVLGVPLMRAETPIGVLVLGRATVAPFTEKQIDLVKTFADQAVIAIENVRLFDEVQARTAELSESLQQQTATADVLKVISRSTFDLQAVLDTLTQSAAQLCEANMAGITRQEAEGFYYATNYNLPSDWLEYVKDKRLAPGRGTVVGRALLDRKIVHVADVLADPEYTFLQSTNKVWFRTVLGVPLMREGNPIGVLVLARAKVQPFTDKQIDLIQTFADQAVIAIENARLFEEVQARTAELGDALQQQTATAEVLKVISRSTFDLPTVFRTLVQSAAQLCGANYGGIYMRQGEVLRAGATVGATPEDIDDLMARPIAFDRKTVSGRVVLSGHAEHIPDVLADPDYDSPALLQFSNTRSLMGVPLLRDGKVDGVFFLGRPETGAFSPRQAELVQTFADQAVIAIENVRLFDEVQARTAELSESLQQQTATADVLKSISRSTFDLQPVLDTLAESAAKLCDADMGVIFKRDGDLYRWSADYGGSSELQTFAKANPFTAGRDSVTGRVALEARAVQVSDVLADAEYGATQLQKLGGYRTILCVPILREGAPVGVFALTRSEVRDFTPRQIELVETFADQAGIAIENVRLFDEVQARTRELSRSLEDLRTAQDRLVQTEKLASLGQLTAGIAHEIKNPLNFVNNFSALSGELIDDLQNVLAEAPLEGSMREEVAELTGMLKGNLDKVVQHGRRADSIVKNMLLHSREGSGEHRPADVNAIVEESLNLAYHGARAEKQGFNITLQRDFDPLAGEVDLYPQEITRVLLNLISNGFYATIKRGAQANGGAYEPLLAASTKSLGDSVEIRIRDNGTGIPPEVREKMFNPFFTTKPVGEGTGLGLSLSHDIVVKQHAGTIDVDTTPGEFTEFRIVLPRAAASLGKSGGEA